MHLNPIPFATSPFTVSAIYIIQDPLTGQSNIADTVLIFSADLKRVTQKYY